MTREEMIETLESVDDVVKGKKKIYAVLDGLGILYKKTNCKKCLRDLKLIALEELGMIDSAADESDFNSNLNYEYIYTPNRPCIWNGYIINQDTPVEVIREFVKKFPNGYYIINNKTE